LASQIYHWILELEQYEKVDELAQLAISSKEKNEKTKKLPIPKILIGTAPKLLQMIEKNELDLSRLQTLVMDEADRLIMPLSRYADIKKKFNRHTHRPPGEQLISEIVRMRRKRKLFTKIPVAIEDQAKERRLQVIISSATANNPLKMLLKSKKWINDPVNLNIGGKIPSKIKHIAYYLDSNEILTKISPQTSETDLDEEGTVDSFKTVSIDAMAESIASICSRQNIKKAIVFVHSEYSVTDLVRNLDAIGLKCARLSDMNSFDGDKLQKPFASWFSGSVDIVVGTEFEARGLDIPNLEHVIIVGTVSPASYTHMSGRTGRFGKSGTAITLLTGTKEKSRFAHTLQMLDISLS
jgi:superfamily II DNA/RNA helicase